MCLDREMEKHPEKPESAGRKNNSTPRDTSLSSSTFLLLVHKASQIYEKVTVMTHCD
jgi:hypothetical protein